MTNENLDDWARAALAALLRQVGLAILRDAMAQTVLAERLMGVRR